MKPDFTSSNHPDNRLFLAFIPEGEAGFEVESIAHRLKVKYGLTGSNNKAFSEFSNQLGSRLGLSRRKVDPHLTLLYDAKSISQHPEGPVSWMVDELVLVRSYVGLGRHEHLARWPLLSRSLCLGL